MFVVRETVEPDEADAILLVQSAQLLQFTAYAAQAMQIKNINTETSPHLRILKNYIIKGLLQSSLNTYLKKCDNNPLNLRLYNQPIRIPHPLTNP